MMTFSSLSSYVSYYYVSRTGEKTWNRHSSPHNSFSFILLPSISSNGITDLMTKIKTTAKHFEKKHCSQTEVHLGIFSVQATGGCKLQAQLQFHLKMTCYLTALVSKKGTCTTTGHFLSVLLRPMPHLQLNSKALTGLGAIKITERQFSRQQGSKIAIVHTIKRS